MQVKTQENETIITNCYSGVTFETDEGEKMSVCMRDGGFEMNYGGIWYRVNQGKISKLQKSKRINPALVIWVILTIILIIIGFIITL